LRSVNGAEGAWIRLIHGIPRPDELLSACGQNHRWRPETCRHNHSGSDRADVLRFGHRSRPGSCAQDIGREWACRDTGKSSAANEADGCYSVFIFYVSSPKNQPHIGSRCLLRQSRISSVLAPFPSCDIEKNTACVSTLQRDSDFHVTKA